MKKKNKKQGKSNILLLKGSFTIEACCIVPIILGVIALVIYMAFLVHDREVLTRAAYTAAFRGSLHVTSGQEQMYKAAKTAAEELIRGRLLAVRQVTSSVETKKDSVRVSYAGKFQIPLGVLANKLLSRSNFELTVSGTAVKKDPVDFIRSVRKVRDLKDKFQEEKKD